MEKLYFTNAFQDHSRHFAGYFSPIKFMHLNFKNIRLIQNSLIRRRLVKVIDRRKIRILSPTGQLRDRQNVNSNNKLVIHTKKLKTTFVEVFEHHRISYK